MAAKILVVDDEPAIRTFVVAVLEGSGYAAQAASGADEALELVKGGDESIGLLLTDIAMPGKNGIDLIRAVRELRPELPVIAMSGNFAAWRGELQGIPCLAKPFAPRNLLMTIQTIYAPTMSDGEGRAAPGTCTGAV